MATSVKIGNSLVGDGQPCFVIAEGGVNWIHDLDFNYEVAEHLPGLSAEDQDILQPKKAFERLGRVEEYDGWVEKLRRERRDFLKTFPDLDPYIVAGV